MRYETIKKRIAGIKNPIGAEIGVFRGEFSKQMLNNIPGLTLYMIDAWSLDCYDGKGNDAAGEASRKIFTLNAAENMRIAKNAVKAHGNSAIIIQGISRDVVKKFADESLDYAFIDACHDEESVTEDSNLWLPKVKKGGWLCGHDYGAWDGVTKAVNKLFAGRFELDEDFTWFVKV